MVIARAFLVRTVEVVITRNAELTCPDDDCLDKLMAAADRRAPERAVGAVKSAISEGSVLEAPEVRQHIRVAPSGVARGSPSIVILALPANGYETVDRARAAERLSPWPIDAAPVHSSIRLGIETPIDGGIEHRFCVTDRNMDPRVGVRRSRLQQQHCMAPVGG